MRLIDADELKEQLLECDDWYENADIWVAHKVIDDMPTTEAGRSGEWEHKEDCPLNYFECSFCGAEHMATFDENDNYCSVCGTRMDGVVDGKND